MPGREHGVWPVVIAAAMVACGGGSRSGPTQPTAPTGPSGPTGTTEPTGTTGTTGPTAPSGPAGPTGTTGPTGSGGGGGSAGGPAAPPAPESGTIRWSDAAPGIFWVGMDDSGARWSAAAVRASSTSPDGGVLRLQRRDRDGHVLWTGEWPYSGTYRFTAAVSPQGEALFSALPACNPDDTACSPSIAVLGVARAGVTVKLWPDGSVRWVRNGGILLGADAEGGTALIMQRSTASTWFVAKLDADANEVWSKEITSIAALALDRTGDVLATGCYQGDMFLLPGIPCQNGMVAARLGLDGSPLWTAQVDGYWAVIGSAADGTEVAASRDAPFELTSISPGGEVRWSRSFGSGLFANQRGDALLVAVAADGPVAVAGYSYPPPPGVLTYGVVTGFDVAGAPTFVLELTTLPPPVSIVYGRDGELVLAISGGTVLKPGGQTENIAGTIVDLVP